MNSECDHQQESASTPSPYRPALTAAVLSIGATVLVASARGAAAPPSAVQGAAQKMWTAFLEGDLSMFAKYSHPVVVKMIGGKGKLVALLRKRMREMKSQGVSFDSVKIDPPRQTVRAGKELHAILPMQIVMKLPDARFRTKSYLIGISTDNGKTWSFIDGSKINPQTVRELLPNFNDELRLPSIAPPEKLDW